MLLKNRNSSELSLMMTFLVQSHLVSPFFFFFCLPLMHALFRNNRCDPYSFAANGFPFPPVSLNDGLYRLQQLTAYLLLFFHFSAPNCQQWP